MASGPSALPDPESWFWPDAAAVADVLLPLVARRTLKRLLVVSFRLHGSPEVLAEWDRLVSALLELPADALESLLVRPEVTALVAGAEESPGDAAQLVLWLGQAVIGAVAAQGGDLASTWIPRSTPRSVALPAASRIGALAAVGSGPVVATVRAGEVVCPHVEVTWRPVAMLAGSVHVSTGRDAWLDRTFPGVEHVAELDDAGATWFVRSLEAAAQTLRAVWLEAHAELLALLRWVVPLAALDSWYVPGMHGLIALGVHSGGRQVRDMFHETSHHKLSRLLELASATRNPEHLVRSPFAREKQPVTSLLQSLWAFAREYELIRRLKADGVIAPADIAREERKFQAFFAQGIPVLRREAQLTAVGDAVLTRIEAAIR